MNTVGKSAFVEAVGRASDDAEGYLDFFKGEIGKTHLAQELWTQIDNGQLAPDLAEIRTSITNVSNEITQTVNKKLENQSAAIQQIQKVQVDTNNNLNSMWAVKLQQMQDGRLYIAGIGAGIENTPAGMQSQVLLAADRIAMINPANGNTKPMFVGQGDQIFMNEVFLKYLTAPTITSGGNPPAFSLTPDGRLTAKNADISGNVNANSGTLNNVTINENCRVLGKLSANQIEGDLVKTVGKAFPRDSRAPERWPSGTITVRVYDDQPFDRQIVIPAVAFSGAKHEKEHTDIYSSCRLIVRKNGAEIYNRTALDNTLIYSGVIDMPAGHGHMTLEFSVSAWLVNNWYLGLRELGTSGEKIPLLSTANTWTNRQTFSGGLSGELSGNASTAAKLKTARKISNVAFDGSSDITLKASHVGAFALGKTGSTVANDKAVGWNWSSGAYNATISGASTLIIHFYMGEGSCPAAQFRINYKNGGIFYRSARDGYGFEADWSEFYTTTRKPSAGDVGALPLSGGQLNGALGIGTSSALGGNSIVLGDNDTGFKQNGDGNLDVYANNVHVMRFVSGSIQSNKTINITGRVNPSDYGNFDSRYVKDVRLGSQQYYGVNNWQTWNFQCPSGHVLSGINVQDTGSNSADNIAGVYYRPVQKYINGTWYNVASV